MFQIFYSVQIQLSEGRFQTLFWKSVKFSNFQSSTQCVGGDIGENFRKLIDGESVLQE